MSVGRDHLESDRTNGKIRGDYVIYLATAKTCRVIGQAAQPVPLALLKSSMAVYGQKLDGRPSR